MTNSLIPAVVLAASPAALDIRQLRLARADGGALPPFTAGAHIDLHLDDQGAGLVRQYSLCGALDELSHYTVAVKRDPASRGGSKAVHDGLQVGARIDISAPRNHFPIASDARHSVLVAGGIGITPLLCMARALSHDGRSFELHYFCRSPEHAAFLDLLSTGPWAPRCHFHFGLEREAVGAVLASALARPADGNHLYLCGPRPFMEMVLATADAAAWPAAAVHLEYFAGDMAAAAAPGRRFEVRLLRSACTVMVEQGVSIADSLRAAGVAIETSCEQGVCGTCITQVVEGEPEHRDMFLSDAEKARGDCMAICVSRARTPSLVLDL